MARARSFGNIRKLPSGRYQARYWRLGRADDRASAAHVGRVVSFPDEVPKRLKDAIQVA